jgi:hypothetical protein
MILLVAEFARIPDLANVIRKSGDFRYVFEDTLLAAHMLID